jgi:hypothetical protein
MVSPAPAGLTIKVIPKKIQSHTNHPGFFTAFSPGDFSLLWKNGLWDFTNGWGISPQRRRLLHKGRV